MPSPPLHTQPQQQSRLLLWLIVFGGGLLLRLVFLYTTRDMGLMIVDEQHYHQLARNLLHYHVFGWHHDAPTSIRPPLYPLFQAVIWTLTGTESLVAIRLAQILLHLVNVYLLYRLGLLLFNQRIALLAAALFWLYPSFLAFNFLLLSEILFTCLLTLTALGYATLLRTGRVAIAWGTGGALGLAALTRSVLWPFPILLCPLLFFTLPGSWQRRGQLALSLLLGFVLVVAPWAIRNTRLQGVFTVIDTMGGLNLMMGNYAYTPLERAWDAVSLKGEQAWSYHLPKTPPVGAVWTEGRKEKWAQQQAFAYMLEHPGLTLKRAAVKLANFWGLERVIIAGWGQKLYQAPLWFTVLGTLAITLTYTLSMLLASLGFFLASRQNRMAQLFLAVVIVFMCAMHTIVFGHERYHLPLMTFLFLYAAAALVQQSWLRLRERGRIVLPPLAIWFLLLCIWGREVLFVESDRLQSLLKLFGAL